MTLIPEQVAASLTPMERELFLGEAKDWGSWMFGVGGDLVGKGLGHKHDGSIYFDTPLADEVRAILTPDTTHNNRRES